MPATLDAARASVQSGEAFKPPPAVDEFSSIATEMGSKGGSAQGVAEDVPEAWNGATKNLSTSISVTATNVTVIEKEAKAQGREPTEEELDEACGPLSFLTKIPSLLGDALTEIYGKFEEFATEFGESVGEFMAKFDELVANVANAVDEAAKAVAEFILEGFKILNEAALLAVDAIAEVIDGVADAVNEAITFATDAFNAAVDKLLAFADTLNFGSLFNLDCQAEAVDEALDKDKIADQAEVNRVMSPPTVNGTDQTVASETLTKPQTEFAPAPSTTTPPSLESRIATYQRAARAYQASVTEARTALSEGRRPNVTRSQQDELRYAQDEALSDLKEAALSQKVDINTLPIHGPNFDSVRNLVEQRRGRDKNGDTVVTYTSEYTKSSSGTSSASMFNNAGRAF